MMSDSTNVMVPGHCSSETSTRENLIRRVADHHGQGRVIVTQFASNLHRCPAQALLQPQGLSGRSGACKGTMPHPAAAGLDRAG